MLGCGTSSRVDQYSQQRAKHVAAPRCLSVVLILDKGEDNRRKRNQGGGGAHLFDMPSPHPSQNPSEARQEERKDNKCVQSHYIRHISRATGLMFDRLCSTQ